MMSIDTDKTAPYVENYPVLEEWLTRLRARHMWAVAVPNPDGKRSQRIRKRCRAHS